jgi:glutathione S-transferase
VCCQKVRITLCEKGQDWEAVSVDLFKGEQYDPNYLKMNPKGVVPTLVHDGRAVTESTLICEYIDSVFPDPPLAPSDPLLRSRMQFWSKLVDEGLFEGVAAISFSAMFRERMKNAPEEIRQARFRNIGDPRRRDRMKSTLEHGIHSPYVLHAIYVYEKAFKLLEETLAEGGPWILGDNPTLADIALMPFTARLDYLGLIDIWLTDRPRVRDWWAMAKEWPSYQRGLADLVTDAEIAEMHAHGPKLTDDITGLLGSLRDGSWNS